MTIRQLSHLLPRTARDNKTSWRKHGISKAHRSKECHLILQSFKTNSLSSSSFTGHLSFVIWSLLTQLLITFVNKSSFQLHFFGSICLEFYFEHLKMFGKSRIRHFVVCFFNFQIFVVKLVRSQNTIQHGWRWRWSSELTKALGFFLFTRVLMESILIWSLTTITTRTLKSIPQIRRSILSSENVSKCLQIDQLDAQSWIPRCWPLVVEVKQMMYGFGDEENPLPESIELLEELVIHFIQDMVSLTTADRVLVLDLGS